MEIILKYFTDFTSNQLAQFTALENLYREWNARINIISRKDIDSLYEKHVLHSLSIAAIFNFQPGSTIIDIGTGGGFPGIPLAIFFPDAQFHLVDSIAKKLGVVRDIVRTIDLKNVATSHLRVEEIKNKKFDFAVTRAVAPLKDLWNWSKPLLKTKGSKDKSQEESDQSDTLNIPLTSGLICLKGGDLENEISESGTNPRIVKIHEIFPEKYFEEKYMLWIPR